MKRILSPSVLSADFAILGEQLALLKKCGVTNIHYDVMDGMYVPSISFGMPVLKSIRQCTDLVLDVHMMVVDPDRYVEDFRKSGADIITVHAEACTHLDRVVNHIKETGAKAAVALNPATPLSALEYVLPELDMVLLMTVNPGFGGQKYIPYCTDKIRALRETADRVNPGLSIQVDGGINPDTVRTVLETGADNLVAGSAVFNGDLAANAEALMNVMKEYH
ncbi:MAG: ribulose-phosphate 3-epimerase [Stomatobaculum sp.]|nr:ribulose-phosphate 3-epimerase [Stomatobaculum sp.]